ncbi:MAG: dTMP kinase [Patescibacteria group bacterium]
MPKRGKFIVLEGGEGSGKTTCLNYLKEHLAGELAIYTREPGGTPLGQKLRVVLLEKGEGDLDPLAEMLLFVAGRAEHVKQVIAPALAAGQHVICDRFAASTYAYQIVANKRPEWEELFNDLHHAILKEAEPDLYLVFDLDPKIGLARVGERRGESTRFDDKELPYHERVRQGLLTFARRAKGHQIIEANQPAAIVRAVALKAIQEIIKL